MKTKSSRCIFTVDWEDWNDALHIHGEPRVTEPTYFLLDILDKYEVKAIFYILGVTMINNPLVYQDIVDRGHIIGWHGLTHYHRVPDDGSVDYFRSPYWDNTKLPYPPAGGFFFRFMPFNYVKWAVKESEIFFLHPHDVMPDHPQIKNPFLNWKRHVGLKDARKKLDRLLEEVEFGTPQD